VFKELQITLYDVFGYLLPGAIILVAILFLFWAVFWPTAPLRVYTKPPLTLTIFAIFLAYLAGHLAWIIHDFASEKRKGALKD
jgi:hypothetical protein